MKVLYVLGVAKSSGVKVQIANGHKFEIYDAPTPSRRERDIVSMLALVGFGGRPVLRADQKVCHTFWSAPKTNPCQHGNN